MSNQNKTFHNRYLQSIFKNILKDIKPKYQTGNWKTLPIKKIDRCPRISWVLAGNEQVGSSRLKGYLINNYVHEHKLGFTGTIAYKQPKQDARLRWQRHEWLPFLKRTDILITQTWAGSTFELLTDCKDHHIPVILTLSDLNNVPQDILPLVDAIVVSSEILKTSYTKHHSRVIVIDDPIEVPNKYSRIEHDHGWNPELVWMGHWMHWQEAEFIKVILSNPEYSHLGFCTVTKHPEATHQWNLRSRWKNLTHSDIAVIPCQMDAWGISKSSNRLATFMALGYPTIVSPIPSYQKLIDHGVNGFFAYSEAEWIDIIRQLRNPALRNQIGTTARLTPALSELRLERVVKQWEMLFSSLL